MNKSAEDTLVFKEIRSPYVAPLRRSLGGPITGGQGMALLGWSVTYGYVLNDPINRIDPYGLWSFTDMPSFSEAFPNSNYIAPIADVAAGGIELGVGVAFGTAGAIGLVAGPEFWPVAAPALAAGVAAGWDGQGRMRTGLGRLGDNTSSDPCK